MCSKAFWSDPRALRALVQVELAEACLTSAKQLELLDMVQKMLAKPGGALQKSRGGKEPESLWYAGRVFLRRDHTSD